MWIKISQFPVQEGRESAERSDLKRRVAKKEWRC